MADTKNPSNKVFDIASSPKATPTSRPLIVGHGPMVQDPTIVNTEDSSEGEKVEVKTLSPKHEIQIKPLNDIKSEPAADDPSLNKEESEEAHMTSTKTDPTVTSSSTAVDKPTPSNTEEQPPKEQEQNPAPEQPVTDAIEPAKTLGSKQSDIDSVNEQKKQEEAAAAAALEHSKHISELVTSQKYFLPINQVEKKRNRQVVFLGVIICVILAIAWIDVALDAGIISNSFHLPHTHFFALKP